MGSKLKSKRLGKFGRVCRWLVGLAILGIIIWGYTFPIDASIHEQRTVTTMNTGWTQIVDGQSYEIPSVQEAMAVEVGEAVVLERTIELTKEERHLLFYSEHKEVQAYIDGELIYSLLCPEGMESFGSSGKRWVDIAVLEEANGKTLRLEISSDFKQYQEISSKIYWVDDGAVLMLEGEQMWLRDLAALVLFCLAIVSYGNATIWENRKLRRYLFAVGDLYLIITLWLCADLNLFALIFKRTAISSLLAMVFIRMIPVAFYHLSVFSDKERPWWQTFVGAYAWFNLILALILQFVFGISMVAQLQGYAIVMLLGTIMCLVGIAHQWMTKPELRKERRIYYASVVLLLAAACESAVCLNYHQWGAYTGIAISVGGIVYACLAHVFLVRNESIGEVKKRELQSRVKVLKRNPLTSQINAHFLGNSLNTISAYCKEDPKKADSAVQLLAKYMRDFMHLVNIGEYVDVEEELQLVQLYLDIQNMRFENAITCEITIGFDEFDLPPLCLQPLVENAVYHGIRTSAGEGLVEIIISGDGTMGQVTIRDNGAGFVMDDDEAYMGVSLTNVKARIVEMGGTMKISSRLGYGTEVILRVPTEYIEDEMNEGDIL